MHTSFQSVAGSVPPSDAPGSSPLFSGPLFPGELNSRAGAGSLSPIQTELFKHTRQERGVTERCRNAPQMPRVYDFAVDHDNALYDLTHAAFDNHTTTMSTECTLSLISPLDLASSTPLFDPTEFESFGSSLYTQFNADPQAWTAAEIPALIIPAAPSPVSFDDVLVNFHEEVEATPNKDTAQSPHTFLMQLAAPPLPQVAIAPSPTPSLSFSAPSTFSSPSPASIVEDDFTMLDYDPDYGPPAFTRANKHSSSAAGGGFARKVRIYAGPATSFPGRSAGRFPCSVPGCKQICKTLGDLKRHESVLAHKPPSWECPRCHYHFTREDALKRHAKNVSNCGSTNVKARGRGASVRPLNFDTTVSTEVL